MCLHELPDLDIERVVALSKGDNMTLEVHTDSCACGACVWKRAKREGKMIDLGGNMNCEGCLQRPTISLRRLSEEEMDKVKFDWGGPPFGYVERYAIYRAIAQAQLDLIKQQLEEQGLEVKK